MLSYGQFNKIINKDNSSIYIPLHNKSPRRKSVRLTAREMVAITLTDPLVEIGMVLPEGYVLLHIHDPKEAEVILKIIQDRNERVMAVRVGYGLDIYAKMNNVRRTTYNVLAIGCHADTVPSNNKDIILTPFKHPKINKSVNLLNMEIMHYNGIADLPRWLHPIYRKSKTGRSSNIHFPLEDRYRDKQLYNHFLIINRIKFTYEEKEELLSIIETYICDSPPTITKFEEITKKTKSRVPVSEFFDDQGKFYHNKMSEYVMEECYVTKDKLSGKLYYYNSDKHIYEHNEEYLKGIMTRTLPILRDAQKNEVLKYMTSYLELDKVVFNKNPFTIVFGNGVLDLATMKFDKHSPDNLETIQLAVDYNPHARSKIVDEFFSTATIEDKELEQLLYEAIGYSFLKTAELAKSFIMVGEGRNGKSTFLDLINAIVGDDNSTAIDLKSLANNFRVSKLSGKLVSLAGDISSTPMNDSDLYKSLVSGDKVMVEEKYKDAYEERLFATMFYSCNTLPRTPDTTSGFYRRFCIIPFFSDLSGVTKVAGMMFKRKLLSKESLEYVAYKAVQAIANVFNTTEEIIEPQICKDILNKYRINNSSSLQWAYDEVDKGSKFDGEFISTMYVKYKLWCETSGYRSQGMARFQDELHKEFNLDIKISSTGDHIFKKKVDKTS